jgi:hypothetical protein
LPAGSRRYAIGLNNFVQGLEAGKCLGRCGTNEFVPCYKHSEKYRAQRIGRASARHKTLERLADAMEIGGEKPQGPGK